MSSKKNNMVGVIFGLALLSIILQSYSTGSPSGYSGSLGDNFNTCSTCHNGNTDFERNWIKTDIPDEGFSPYTTYNITLTVSHLGAKEFGFCFSSEDNFGETLGFLYSGDGSKLIGNEEYVTHTYNSRVTDDSAKWVIQWQSPPFEVDSVLFSAAFNATNANNSKTGDTVYVSSLVAYPNKTISSIEENNVINDNLLYSFNNKTIKLKSNENFNVTVYDMKGCEIYKNTNCSTANLKDLDLGMYICIVDKNGLKLSDKILIL